MCSRSTWLLVGLACLGATPALGQPSEEPPASVVHSDEGYRSPAAASAWALGTTLGLTGLGVVLATVAPEVGGTLILIGLVPGPAAGHLYSGENLHALLTAIGRLLSIGALALAASEFCILGECEEPGWVFPATLGGTLGLLGLTIYDLVDAPAAARRHKPATRALHRRLASWRLPAPRAPRWPRCSSWGPGERAGRPRGSVLHPGPCPCAYTTWR